MYSDRCVELVKKWEGFRDIPYICPGNRLTVGYGHSIQDGERFDHPMSEEKAMELLYKDLDIAARAVNSLVTSPLNQNQFDALTSFVFNLGQGNFANSTLLRLLNAEEYEKAAEEFSRWIHASGQVQRGLVLRRADEKELFLEPIKKEQEETSCIKDKVLKLLIKLFELIWDFAYKIRK